MSEQITTHFHRVFSEGIELLAQQFSHVLAGTYMPDNRMGEAVFFDQVGSVRMQEKTGRAVDLPTIETPHARRMVTPKTFQMRDFIDEMDKLEVLNDPTNAYSQTFLAAGNREKDKLLIDALLGTANTGKTGTTAVALPATQKIAAGGTGFTFAKVQQAVRLLKQKNAIMPGDEIFCAITAFQEEEFINTTEVKSSDFNNRKVLVEGEIGQFYKVNFRLVEDVEANAAGRMLPFASGERSTVMWVRSGATFNIWRDVYGRVAFIDEKESWQVSAGLKANATRMQEVKVVQIDAVES